MEQPELGKRISELRKSKGLTQEELVERSLISIRTIQRIESGEVTPRSYTIKTVLAALDCEMSDLQLVNSISEDSARWLKFAWIAGLAYFLLGFPESILEISRLAQGTGATDYFDLSFLPIPDFSQSFYIIIKLLIVITYAVFFRGFEIVGSAFNNPMLRIISMILIGSLVLFIGYDILSLFYDADERLFVLTGISFTYGILGIIFGIALIKLRSSLGRLCLVAAGVEIITGSLFLFAPPVALVFQIAAELLEIIVLYKSSQILITKSESQLA